MALIFNPINICSIPTENEIFTPIYQNNEGGVVNVVGTVKS